eukprot:s1444_g5.t1
MLLADEAYLLAEAEVYCHRLSRSRTAWSLERDTVAVRITAAEERLRALRIRNEELASNVRLLEEALSSCRRRSAQCLPGSQLFHGCGPIQETRTFPCEEIEAWRALALRIPATRKNWETKTFDSLSRAGQAYILEESGLRSHGAEESQLESATLESSAEGSRELYDVSNASRQDKERPWEVVATLHSHLDGVRSARICQGVLLTAGEDSIVKAWDIGSMPGASIFIDGPCEDLEPFANYRAHSGPVMTLAVPDGEENLQFPVCFSGGMDGDIYSFEMISPSENDENGSLERLEPEVREPQQMGHLQSFRAHRDAVVSLDLQPKLGLLASAGLDNLVLLWRVPQETSIDENGGMRAANAPLQALDIPPPRSDERSDEHFGPLTGVAWGPRGSALLLCCSSAASTCCAMDVEHGAAIYSATTKTREDAMAPVLAIASHAERDLAVSGHADGKARIFSPLTGRPMWNLRCGKSVTAVALDPFGSGSEVIACRDGVLLIFDTRMCHCIQEVPLHGGEAIHWVCHAGVLQRQQVGGNDLIVTAGADATVNVLDRTTQ